MWLFPDNIPTISKQGIMDKKPVAASSADNNNNKLAVISCAKNCEKIIDDSISSARKNCSFQQGNGITILTDAFSTDDTRQAAVKAGVSLVMQQPSNKFPGKGIAMKCLNCGSNVRLQD